MGQKSLEKALRNCWTAPIIGITLKPSTLKRWESSLILSSQIVRDVSDMKDESRKVSVTVGLHKEKMPARNQSDGADKKTLRESLTACIEPLNPNDYPNHLVSFVCAGSWSTNSWIHTWLDKGWHIQRIDTICSLPQNFKPVPDDVGPTDNEQVCNGQMQLVHRKTVVCSVL